MLKWKLYQYESMVDSFFNSCGSDMKEAIEERLDLLSEKGNMCKMPVSKPIGNKLFALRVKENRQQVRLIYFFRPGKEIVFVHIFYKTT